MKSVKECLATPPSEPPLPHLSNLIVEAVLLQVTAIVALSSTMMSPFRALFEGFKTFYLLALKSGVPGRGSMGEGSVMGSIEAVIGDICQNSEQL
jgi:hypothetical protein